MAANQAEISLKASFRREESAGEATVGTLRLIGLAVFYLNEMVNYHALGVAAPDFHRRVTWLVGLWALLAAAGRFYVARRGEAPRPLKYVSSALDVLFVTMILSWGQGPRSPLVVLYYIVIGVSNLRYSVPLTVFTTALSAAAYGALFAHARAVEPAKIVSAHAAVIHVLGMLVTGLLAGYVVGRLKRVTTDFVEGFVRRRKIEGAFSRYVSYQVAEKILQNVDSLEGLKGERRRVTVLMTDIRGFTPLCSRLPPEQVVALLSDYFERITQVVFEFEGTIDKFIGDAVLVVFGAPVDQTDSPIRAAGCALKLQRTLAAYNDQRAREGRETVRMGIGLNTGEVVAGNVGSERRLEYTVLGDAVNLTQRLCGAAAPDQIVMSGTTHREVYEIVEAKALPPFQVKGRADPVQAYELVGLK